MPHHPDAHSKFFRADDARHSGITPEMTLAFDRVKRAGLASSLPSPEAFAPPKPPSPPAIKPPKLPSVGASSSLKSLHRSNADSGLADSITSPSKHLGDSGSSMPKGT